MSEPLGLLHIQPPNQDSEGGDDTKTKRDTPDGPEVVRTEARTPYQTKSRKIEENTNIQWSTSGTKAETMKPKSIILLVARANQRFWAFFETFSPSDCSEAATEPQGYSAPTPVPRKNL